MMFLNIDMIISSIDEALDLAEQAYYSHASHDPEQLRQWQIVFIKNYIIQKVTQYYNDPLHWINEMNQESSKGEKQ